MSDGRHVAGALAGLAGGAAFAAVMALDQRLGGRKLNDYRLLADAGPLAHWWPVTGPLVHATNSLSVGAVYSAVEPRLCGPGWLRGLTFALLENVLLWPIVLVVDRFHPSVRRGELEHFNTPGAFAFETWRHAAYGLVLGTVYERLRRSR